jgi:hypothetical protein
MPSPEPEIAPAFYGARTGGRAGDWLTLLHPPYTAWHLAYVAIGAALIRPISLSTLGWSLLGFFLGVGIGAHALDELHGRPLRTSIPSWQLVAVGIASVVGAAIDGWLVVGVRLLPFIAVGALVVFAYNLEWFRGRIHNEIGFAAAWGAFPLLTGAFAQHGNLSVATAIAAVGAFALSWAQRALSTQARWLRRSARDVTLQATVDERQVQLTAQQLLEPTETALKAMAWAIVLLAIGLVVAARWP